MRIATGKQVTGKRIIFFQAHDPGGDIFQLVIGIAFEQAAMLKTAALQQLGQVGDLGGVQDGIGLHGRDGRRIAACLLELGGSRLRMTPLYDILTAQPALNARQIERKQMKMAMSVGNSRHYRFDQIHGRHFVQTAMHAGLSKKRAMSIIEDIEAKAPEAMETAAKALPKGFPMAVVDIVSDAVNDRLRGLQLADSV